MVLLIQKQSLKFASGKNKLKKNFLKKFYKILGIKIIYISYVQRLLKRLLFVQSTAPLSGSWWGGGQVIWTHTGAGALQTPSWSPSRSSLHTEISDPSKKNPLSHVKLKNFRAKTFSVKYNIQKSKIPKIYHKKLEFKISVHLYHS